MQAQTLRDAFLLLDPRWVLTGADLTKFYVSRQDDPLSELAEELTLPRRGLPPKILFTGHKGSGKSTELMRLAGRLDEQFFVVPFTVEESLDLFNMTYVEVLLVMGINLFQEAQTRGIQIKANLLQDLYDSLYTLFGETIERSGASAEVGGRLEGLFAWLKGNLLVGATTTVTKKIEVQPLASELLRRLNLIIADVQSKSGKDVLIIIDGLDKLSKEIADDVFKYSSLLTQPACRVVYTVPYALHLSPGFALIKRTFDRDLILPNIKTHTREDKPDPEGLDTLRQVVLKRVAPSLFAPTAIERLVESSGGAVRDLVQLAQDSCKKAQVEDKSVVDEEVVSRVINAFADTYRVSLKREHYRHLRHIRRTKTLMDVNSQVTLDLLQSLSVLGYSSQGRSWFDVHPIVWPLLEEEQAVPLPDEER